MFAKCFLSKAILLLLETYLILLGKNPRGAKFFSQKFSQNQKGGTEFFPIGKGGTKMFLRMQRAGGGPEKTGNWLSQTDGPLSVKNDSSLIQRINS